MHTPMTLARFLLSEDKLLGSPEPEFQVLFAQMAFAAKIISREVRRAALVGTLGLTGDSNPTGDIQKKLDVYANNAVIEAFTETGLVAGVVSEELESFHSLAASDKSRYILSTDPLDGSSNTDINGPVGSIFGFYRRSRTGPCEDIEAELREGAKLVAASYVLYGPSTVLVYSRGRGVHGFTLEHDLDDFLLSHENIRCPAHGNYYSANLGNAFGWAPEIREFVDHLTDPASPLKRRYSLRYFGALIADLHRSLLEGGIYFYPADRKNKNGKLRLVYECAPLAFLTEKAGGRASTGSGRILDVRLDTLHQRVPMAIGSREEVEIYERFLAAGSGAGNAGK